MLFSKTEKRLIESRSGFLSTIGLNEPRIGLADTPHSAITVSLIYDFHLRQKGLLKIILLKCIVLLDKLDNCKEILLVNFKREFSI